MSRSYQLLNRANGLIEKKAYRDARAILRIALKEDSKDEAIWLSYLETCQRPSERQRVIHQWIQCDPASLIAKQLFEEANTVRYTLPEQESSLRTWLRERTSILSLSTALIVIFLLSIWLFTTSRNVSAEVETAAAPSAPIVRDAVVEAKQTIQLLNEQVLGYKEEIKTLSISNGLLEAENKLLKDNQAAYAHNQSVLEARNAELEAALNQAQATQSQQDAMLARLRQTPYTIFSEGEIQLAYTLRDKTNRVIVLDYAEFQTIFGMVDRSQNYNGRIQVETDDGMVGYALDLRPFVKPDTVRSIATQLDAHHADDHELIKEIWHFVGQFRSGSTDLAHTPQYPLETIIKGSGDVEDRAILLASLLAAVEGRDWEIHLVYVDETSPSKAHAPNHLLVRVRIDTQTYYIDASHTGNMEPFGDDLDDDWVILVKQ